MLPTAALLLAGSLHPGASLERMELNVAKKSGTCDHPALPLSARLASTLPSVVPVQKTLESTGRRLPGAAGVLLETWGSSLAPPLFPGNSHLALPTRTAQEWRKRS